MIRHGQASLAVTTASAWTDFPSPISRPHSPKERNRASPADAETSPPRVSACPPALASPLACPSPPIPACQTSLGLRTGGTVGTGGAGTEGEKGGWGRAGAGVGGASPPVPTHKSGAAAPRTAGPALASNALPPLAAILGTNIADPPLASPGRSASLSAAAPNNSRSCSGTSGSPRIRIASLPPACCAALSASAFITSSVWCTIWN
eukprot:scaffold5032_cov88-Isochrysis_galbana.AAC.8